ncbi:unnamed protein product [Arctia plantaginis]|uniref:RWD domain-containing protein n=1 Tax=Arctia plantaginis TaxID=874455 RepID=A0A8S0YYJ6_ARCPL|nr:unnamed protein product [Arctia plantaginis]
MRDTLINCLSQQLSEYELLTSMYPNQGEIVLSEKNSIVEINNFIDNKTEKNPSPLDFKINLLINNLKLEVFINLPALYPKEAPDLYVRCNQMNRASESKLNSDLFKYIAENYNGEVFLYTAICWLQENIEQFTVVHQELNQIEEQEPEIKIEQYARFWVYSHHIYNKRKREEIIKKARELKLTGFSLPGKPGIVCVEGHHSDCNNWWKDIKTLSWQKITLRKTEKFPSSEEKTYKKFSNFEELNFSKKDLAKYMNELGLNHEFNDLFGLCNDT